jgi:hypothetical protein
MTTTTISREEAINIIHSSKSGMQTDLLSQIGQKLFEDFCLLGFIKMGATTKGEKTWAETTVGADLYEFYRKPTQQEANMGIYYASLGF